MGALLTAWPPLMTGPDAADDRMRRFVGLSLLDWSNVGIAGRNEPVAQATAELARAERGLALLLAGGYATPRAAALANGAASPHWITTIPFRPYRPKRRGHPGGARPRREYPGGAIFSMP